MPATSQLFHTDKVITQFAARRGRNRFIAELLLPGYNVTDKTSKILRIDPEDRRRKEHDDTRIPGHMPNLIAVSQDRELVYDCQDHALASRIPPEHQTKPGIEGLTSQSMNRGMYLVDVLLLRKEARILAHVRSTLGTAGNVLDVGSTAPENQYDADPDNNTEAPIPMLKRIIQQQSVRAGQPMNALHTSREVLNAIMEHPDTRDRVKYTQGPQQTGTMAGAGILAALLDIQEVNVADIVARNLNPIGDTTSADDYENLWEDEIFVTYKEAPSGETSNFGQLMRWTTGTLSTGQANQVAGGLIDGWRVNIGWMVAEEAWHIAAHQYYDPKIINPASGFHLKNLLAGTETS